MSGDNGLSVFNAKHDDLSTDWKSFLELATVNAIVTVPDGPAAGSSKSPNLNCTNTRFWGFKFDTAATESRFQKEDYLVGDSVLMSLSTDTADPPTTDLGKVISALDFSTAAREADNLPNAIIDAFGTELQLHVDTTEPRNAVWLTAGQTFRLDTALCFVPIVEENGVLDAIATKIKDHFSLNLSDALTAPKIFIQRTCRGTRYMMKDGKTQWYVRTVSRLTFNIATSGFLFWISLEPSGVSFSMTEDTSLDLLDTSVWGKLGSLYTIGPSKSSAIPVFTDILSRVRLVRATVGKNTGGEVWWQIDSAMVLVRSDGKKSGKDPVDLYLSYDSQSSTFSGGLILAGFYATADDKLLPDYAVGRDVDEPDGQKYPPYWDLKQVCTELDSLPVGLPTAIAMASITYLKDPSQFWLRAELISTPGSAAAHSVPSPFSWEGVDLSLSKGEAFSCTLSTYFKLRPPPDSPYTAADLGLVMSYDDGNWLLGGYIENLSCGLLYSFFDTDCRDAAVAVLSKLTINSLRMLYTYDSRGAAASFLFQGTITLGTLQLRLFYQYASSRAGDNSAVKRELPDDGPELVTATGVNPDGTPKTEWKFECDLGASSDKATIGSIVNSICDDAAGLLPSFVSDIKIPSTTNRSFISLKLAKTGTGKALFMFRVTISSFTLTFLQVAYNDDKTKTKRLLRFSVDQIPMIEDIPLLDRLPQPFNQLEYLWVNQSGGWLKSEVDAVNNSKLLSGPERLLYKQSNKANSSKDSPPSPSDVEPVSVPDPVVILPGHHFVVVQGGEVVIDHVFFTSKPKADKQPPTETTETTETRLVVRDKASAPEEVPPGTPAKGALSFTFGPLAVDAVTLQFKDDGDEKLLAITMDATFTMGPISFSLLGFGIAVPLKDIKLDDLKSVASHITVVLQGLALSFDKPPLLLAGAFEHAVIGSGKDRKEIYMGGIGVTYPPYTFVGLGEYAILEGYKSVFIFAKLDGPLVTLEFATISGVRLGFGYNSVVRSPTVNELASFPFINDHSIEGAGNDPMKILKAMTTPGTDPVKAPAWVTPKVDSYWLAVGMSVTAFEVLAVTAVAMVAFRDSGLIISLFANAIAQMPPSAPKEEVIVYAEINIVAEMNLVDGYFRVEAALAPSSYLLVPSCHLEGGFALVYWFDPNDHAGDWVFSIGGYHRSYKPPEWYPVPKRLGISFQVGSCLSVTGESYFAVTPKVAMGGALIHVSLDVGPISAWLDAAFDALVNFHPLHYSVDFSVAIGVTFDADLWFIHIHITAQVGAQLHVEGPEFGGIAHVDFYLFGFNVDFGAAPAPVKPLDLLQFWEMLHNPGPQAAKDDKNAKEHASPVRSFLMFDKQKNEGPKPFNEPGAALKYILENGNFPMPKTPDPEVGVDSKTSGRGKPGETEKPDKSSSSSETTNTGAGAKWFVKGGSFQFRIASDFALTKALITLSPESVAANKAAAAAAAAAASSQDGTKPGEPATPSSQPGTSSASQDPAKADEDENIHYRVIKSDTKPVYSRPMQVTVPITSTLTVTIKNKVTEEIIDDWQEVSFAPKDVPTAIWSQYSRASDPQSTRNPSDLLKGGDATVKQSMALMLTAPPPELAKSFIPVFKATAAAKFGVLDFRKDTEDGTNWILPIPEPEQTEYLPEALTTEELAESNADRWEGVMGAWSDLADKGEVVNDENYGVLAICSSIFAWDKNRPQGEAAPATALPPGTPVRQPWQLVGTLPSKMISNLEATYLDLPRFAVVAA